MKKILSIITSIFYKSPWKTDFKAWVKSKPSAKAIARYCNSEIGEITDANVINYVDYSGWGHRFKVHSNFDYGMIHYGSGFYMRVIGGPKLEKGSLLLLNTESGKAIHYLVLHVTFETNPSDMYWAYIIGVSEESIKKTNE